jgi:hypothetical protein
MPIRGPDCVPFDTGDIKPKRTYARRTRYLARNELSRLQKSEQTGT